VRLAAPPGTHDVFAREWPEWETIVKKAEELCLLYGYRRITTPVFEDTELFRRTSGIGSDLVQKEMYSFTDRGGRSLTLRPEGTAPIARAYVQHGLHREGQPVKLFTISPMYRYARSQKGRYREHWQLSVEALGSGDPAIDAELIQLYAELLRALRISSYTLLLNSIGDHRCRPAYLERLVAWLEEHDSELDAEAREKRATSPLRVFDVKSTRVQAALARAPRIGESLCEPCAKHFAQVQAYLDAYEIAYELAPTLVRGLDYYTRTTWEFVGPEGGAQSTLSGGGRYDGLVEEIGSPPTPGVGFGAGIERLHLSFEQPASSPERVIEAFFAVEPGTPREEVLTAMAALRRRGVACDTEYAGRSLKGQLTQAERLGARSIVIVTPGGATVRRRGDPPREFPTVAEAAKHV
jgi:histidyl-tRNA synthetase